MFAFLKAHTNFTIAWKYLQLSVERQGLHSTSYKHKLMAFLVEQQAILFSLLKLYFVRI